MKAWNVCLVLGFLCTIGAIILIVNANAGTMVPWSALLLMSVGGLLAGISDTMRMKRKMSKALAEESAKTKMAVEALAPLLRNANRICEHHGHLIFDQDILSIELKATPEHVTATLEELVRWSQRLTHGLELSAQNLAAHELRTRQNTNDVVTTLLKAAKQLEESRGADLTATRATCRAVRCALVERVIQLAPLLPPGDFVRALRSYASPASLLDVVADHAQDLPTDQPDGGWARELLKFAMQNAGKHTAHEPPPAAT